MQEPRKYILDRFQEHLRTSFETFCAQHGIEKTDNSFVTYLIDQDFISPAHLQRYTVLREYEKISTEQNFPKTQAVDALAHRFCISERTVWSILKSAKPKKKSA